MAQQILAGHYQLQIDGHRLVVRDQQGQVVETMDNVETGSEVRLPDGTTISAAALADALLNPRITEIDTAAGAAEPVAATGVESDGGLGLTAYVPGVSIGGLTAVGRLDATDLGFGETEFTDGQAFADRAAYYKMLPAAGEASTYAPIAEVLGVATGEDSPVNGAVLATDRDQDPLGYTLVDGPAHGSLQFAADGTFTYKPDADFSGTDSFTYRANDGSHDSNVAAVNITVTPIDDAPVVVDDAFTIAEDVDLAGAVNGSDVDGDKLTYAIVDAPLHGAIDFNADGTFTYKPDADFNGSDSFTYRASDGSLDSNLGRIDITVTAANDAPEADDAALVLYEDATFFAAVHAQDADGDALGYTLVDAPLHGILLFNPDGSFAYTPDADYAGSDSFTFRASDGSLDSNTAKIDLTVVGVNDAPVAADAALATGEDSPVSGQVVAHDVDSPALGYTIVDAPQHGTVQFNADGSFKYTPNANYSGTDTFTYRASDGSLVSNAAKVDITVKPVNDAPVVTAVDAHGDVHIVDINNAQKLYGTYSIGDYLASAGKESTAIDANMVNGVDTSSLTLSQATEMKVSFLSEGAGYRSMVGTYTFDDKGNIDPASLKLLWLDGTAVKENTANSAMVKDFLGNSQPGTVSLGQLPAGTQTGFFIISDGASNAANKALIAGVAGVNAGSDNYAGDLAAINQKLGVTLDAYGNGHITVNGTALNGNTYFTHDAVLNTDANSNDMLHAISGITSKNDGKLYIGFEDLAGGGDKDYNDIIIAVDIGSYNVNRLTQGVAQPTVHITDVDSTTLADATVTTTGFHAGDHLNVPSSALFDVTVTANGNDTVIQVVAKSGAESIASFENFLNGIFFSSSSIEEGSRTVHYAVTDAGGAHSNIGDAQIQLTASYDISASQLGGRTALGAGDDTLHLNQTMSSHLDLGSGYDTVKFEQANMGFGHADAAKLQNVEAIDASGYGKNVVTLSIDDVLTMSDSKHHLTVVGNTGDSLTLVGDGTSHWQVTGSDAAFTTVAFDNGVHQAVIVVSNELSLTVS